MSLALRIAGTSYTLPEASVRSLVHTVQACQPATLSAQIYASGIPTHSIARDSAIELWVDGVRRFAGTIPKRPLTGYDSQGSYIDLNAVDLLGRLRSITYERPGLTWSGKSTTAPSGWGFPDGTIIQLYKLSDQWDTSFGLFSLGLVSMDTDTDGATLYAIRGTSSSEAELVRFSAFLSARHDIDLELGTINGLPTKNTVDEITELDCLSVLQKCAALRPDATFWIDPSTGTNRLNYITRDHCTAITLDVNDRTRITANKCEPRDDLQVGYIKFTLNWVGVREDGSWYQDSTTTELGDPTCAPERRIIRSFNLGKFGVSTGVSGLPYVWEVPTGAAAAYWAAASVLHYEGQCSVYEPNGVSYAYGLGHVVNFSNWQPGYDTARALARGVTYDLVSRRTSISFGPPDSLTPQDYLSIAASSLGSVNPATDPTAPTTDPSAPGSGGLPAHVLGDLYNLFSVESTTGTVQVIEGTATLKGWTALHPSFAEIPPQKWLNLVYSGSLTGKGDMYCDGTFEESTTLAASGTAIYDPVTDAITPVVGSWSGSYTASVNITSQCSGGPGSVGMQYPFFAASATSGYKRATQWEPYVTDQCPLVSSQDVFPSTWVFGSMCYASIGRVNVSLANKDTEQNAIARLGDTWADPVGAGEKKTYWEQRTTDFSFGVRRCRLHGYSWTCSVYGLPVKVSIPLFKYPVGGTKPATPTATQPFTLDLVQLGVTTTSPQGLTLTEYHGKATLPDWELPYEKGYVIEAGNISITLL